MLEELLKLPLSLESSSLRAQLASFALHPRAYCRSFLTSYTANRVRHTLPIVSFAFRNERVQRFEHLLFTELGDELFKLRSTSAVTGARSSGRNVFGTCRALTFFLALLALEPATARSRRKRLRASLALAMQFNNASQQQCGCSTWTAMVECH
jgi:hypothetical protein